MKLKNFLLELTETFLTSLVVILLLYVLVASVEVVYGASMEPNFHSGERILVDKITKRIKGFERGEVVVFFPPGDDSKHYVKRVIGIPGDIIKIVDCKILISRDGEKFKLDETYLSNDVCTAGSSVVKEGRSLRIEDGKYLLLGDNRNASLDSRVLGLVEEKKIIGRVIFRFWPISAVGFIN
ncbi:MAG: signal peptidase I [Patescibacteria group bacterium]|nr:signal peptidase I [Patescibacteria group bacterium]